MPEKPDVPGPVRGLPRSPARPLNMPWARPFMHHQAWEAPQRSLDYLKQPLDRKPPEGPGRLLYRMSSRDKNA